MSVINDALKKASEVKKKTFAKPPEVPASLGLEPGGPVEPRPKGSVKDNGNSAGLRPTPATPNRLEKWIMLLFFGMVVLLVLIGLFLTKDFFFKTKEVAPWFPPAVVQDKPGREEVVPQKTVLQETARDVHIPDKIVPDKPAPPEVIPAEQIREVYEEESFDNAPEFSLTGIVFGAGEPSAIINGNIVKEGDVIQGAKVLEIKPKKVKLDFKGKEISLLMSR